MGYQARILRRHLAAGTAAMAILCALIAYVGPRLPGGGVPTLKLWMAAAGLAMISVGLHVAVFRDDEAAARRRERRCVGCDYDLTGNVSGVCPECGRPVGRG